MKDYSSYDSVEVTVKKIVPSPQIYANGEGRSVTISTGEQLAIAVSLASGVVILVLMLIGG